ncbi:MAG: hypothetical protein GC204_17355 [Chloroflexi bacterium]|nr:hypothetical protein [Chloroflexota bacterium]
MFPSDFSETGFLYQERLRDAENRRIYNGLVKSAEAYRRKHGQVSFLNQLMQRFHIKAQQPQAEVSDSRHAHAL